MGGPGGAAIALILERTATDSSETLLSLVTAGVDGTSDVLAGKTYIDNETNELVLGQQVIVTALEMGTDVLIPASPEADAGINAVVLGYDVLDLLAFDNTLQLRVSLAPSSSVSDYYFVYNPYANVRPDAVPSWQRPQ